MAVRSGAASPPRAPRRTGPNKKKTRALRGAAAALTGALDLRQWTAPTGGAPGIVPGTAQARVRAAGGRSRMATELRKEFAEMQEMFGQVPSWAQRIPESGLQSFWTMMRDFELAETRIPNKYKELIGLAVSGATRCRYCALFHTESAKLFGATDEEIAEASLMGGVTMMGSTFLNAEQVDYDTFRKETLEIVEYVKAHQTQQSQGAPQPQRTQAAGHA
jgi:AhpD family alkylhydroperoxidase